MRPSLALLRTSRSAWKGPFFINIPYLTLAKEEDVPIFTQARSCTILPNFVGAEFMVHNGMEYVPLEITQDMIGHKLGEFAHTKKKFTAPPMKGTRK